MKKAVFLDRDGVINEAIVNNNKPYPPNDIASLKLIPKVTEALNNLHRAVFFLAVITNQPDVYRGKVKRESVEEINQFLTNNLPLDVFKTCYHDDNDFCSCRKPLPGSFLEVANEYKIDLKNSYMVGDRWRDIEAGIAAGCKTFFIDYQYDEKRPTYFDYKVSSLFEASTIILDMAL